jgi:predicted flavoprotein YhiN
MGFEKAVVADGGVTLKQVNTRTMQSALIKNLYITGDLLDINRPTGGYSLQLCWTSAYIAAINSVSNQ